MNNIEQFFKTNLDGKTAQISAGGLYLEGGMEQKCKLEFIEFSGLHCNVNIEYNRKDILSIINKIIIEDKEEFDITYTQRDQILDAITLKLKESNIQGGKISAYGVKELTTLYDNDVIQNVKIKYKDGSIVEIRGIHEDKP